MAIRRCPYCKAIIEEGADFCSNCGTQLLFPEDEKIEEEIPGEKIVDDDDDEDEETATPEEEKDADPAAGDLLESAEEEEPPLLHEEEVESAESTEKKTEKSVDLQKVEVDQEPEEDGQEEKDDSVEFQIEEQEVLTEGKEAEPNVEVELSEEEILEEESIESQELSSPPENEINLEGIDEEEVIKEIKKETPSDSKEDVLKMEDLEKTVESSEYERKEIDRFIDSMRQDQGEDIVSVPFPKEPVEASTHIDETPVKEDVPDVVPPPEESQDFEEPIHEEPPQEEPVFEEPIEEEPDEEKIVEDSPSHSSTPPLFEKKVLVPPTDDLPAWASKIEEKPPSSIPMTESEKEFVPQEKTPALDTGMGLPEVVAQKDLPFSRETIEAKKEKPKEPPSQFSTWLKPRAFDVLFIGAVWFITTWIASYVMEVKLFKLISAAALLLMAFYVVLLSAYLFLFFFFLGETLGDYLFNPKHRSGLHRSA